MTPLKPFWSFFGSKWNQVRNYPAPQYGTIVEPFAGSACYALHYYDRKVVLSDVDPIICCVWDYLIRSSEAEILALPDIRDDEVVSNLPVPQEARWLIGYACSRAAEAPRTRPHKWMRDGVRPASFWGPQFRQRIASQLGYIRHWRVVWRGGVSYQNLPTGTEATWFIDPPYQTSGKQYRFGSNDIDYKHLAQWCLGLPGQVIVCEAEGATWLPFQRSHSVTNVSRKKSKEVLFTSLGVRS